MQKSVDYLARQVQNDSELQAFELNLKKVFDYFDKEKKLPVISTNKKGEYIFL